MKPTIPSIFLLAAFTLFTESSCHKTKPSNPLDQLPPATQTGANTFGCLIHGEVFIPKGFGLSAPHRQCTYIYLQDNYDTGYFFSVSAADKSSPPNLTSVGIFTDSLELQENKTYPLVSNGIRGEAYGTYNFYTAEALDSYYTSSQLPGELRITKYDSANQIVSGTFWFNILDKLGDTVKITDGRFDMHFTR